MIQNLSAYTFHLATCHSVGDSIQSPCVNSWAKLLHPLSSTPSVLARVSVCNHLSISFPGLWCSIIILYHSPSSRWFVVCLSLQASTVGLENGFSRSET